MAAPTSHGRFQEYQQEIESIDAYLEQINLYFAVNSINEEKKVAVFLTVIGGKNYTLLRNLLALTQLSDLPLQQLKDALQKYFEPKRMVIQ